MLVIKITGGNANGQLQFEVNGNPSPNGNGRAKQGWQVQWNVHPQTDVVEIEGIHMKQVPNNTDIFTDDPPAPQGNKRHWRAMVDSDAPIGPDKYTYAITWLHRNGNTLTHDPKISVFPSGEPIIKHKHSLTPLLAVALIAFAGFYAFKILNGNKRWK